jgi:hypothetical protein
MALHQHDMVVKVQERDPSQVNKAEEDRKKKGKEILEEGTTRNKVDSEEDTEVIGIQEQEDLGEEVEGHAEGMQIIDNEVYYEVEAIRKKRNFKGQLQYLIKWFFSFSKSNVNSYQIIEYRKKILYILVLC